MQMSMYSVRVAEKRHTTVKKRGVKIATSEMSYTGVEAAGTIHLVHLIGYA